MVKKLEDAFTRFDRIHERDRQTDGRTNAAQVVRRHRPRYAALRGKNQAWKPDNSIVDGKMTFFNKSNDTLWKSSYKL